MKAVLHFAPLLLRLWRPLLVSLLLSLLTLAMGIGLLGLSGWFLTAAALSTAGSSFNLFGPSAGVRGLSFLRILSRYGEKVAGHDATLRLLADLRRWLFGKLFPLVPLGRRFGRADLVSRLTADIDALDTVFLVALGPLATAGVAGIAMTVLLALVLPAAALPYALAALLTVLALPPIVIVLSRRSAETSVVASAELRGAVLDGIDGHQDIILFEATDEATERARDAGRRLSDARRDGGRIGSLASAGVQLLAGSALLTTLLAGLSALSSGKIESPLLVGLLLAVVASFEASAMLIRSTQRLAAAAEAARRLADVERAQPAISEPVRPETLPRGGVVTFEDVGFGYDGRNSLFDHLTMSVTPGECIAIKGASGSGKSTLAHLLVRLAQPTQGCIRINGVNIAQVSSSDLRERLVMMTQDAPVFLDTLRSNLLIGRPGASDAQLWQMLAKVGLDSLVRSLPEGLDSVVGEAGRTLSSGQSRRLCLARTLLSKADIVICDEPTSGLDPEAEAAFFLDLRRIAEGRTAIIITHAALPEGAFDRVLELRAGRLQ